MDNYTSGDSNSSDCSSSSFALSGKVMLSSVVILFAVVAAIIFLHSYVRWLLRRGRSRRERSRGSRRSRVRSDSDRSPAVEGVVDFGLDASILKSLPTFVYSKAACDGRNLECAVCLSEFEDDENGRRLPKCNHCFHNDCIETWFHSHSNCPLCRAPVLLHIPEPVVTEVEPAAAEAISGDSPRCPKDDDENDRGPSSSSTPGALPMLECPRKPLELVGITVEMPAAGAEEAEVGTTTTESQSSKSPGSRVLSLKRIWSIQHNLLTDRKADDDIFLQVWTDASKTW